MYNSYSGTITLVVVVDDILMACNSGNLLEDFKEEMRRLFLSNSSE